MTAAPINAFWPPVETELVKNLEIICISYYCINWRLPKISACLLLLIAIFMESISDAQLIQVIDFGTKLMHYSGEHQQQLFDTIRNFICKGLITCCVAYCHLPID
jgi:hypothetical protein